MKTYYEALFRKRMATTFYKLVKKVCNINNIPSTFSRQTGQFLVSLCQSICYLLLGLKNIIQKQASVVRLRVGYMKSNYTVIELVTLTSLSPSTSCGYIYIYIYTARFNTANSGCLQRIYFLHHFTP